MASPLPGHHDEQEGKTAEFEQRYGLVLADVCAEFAHLWQEKGSDA